MAQPCGLLGDIWRVLPCRLWLPSGPFVIHDDGCHRRFANRPGGSMSQASAKQGCCDRSLLLQRPDKSLTREHPNVSRRGKNGARETFHKHVGGYHVAVAPSNEAPT